MGWEAPTVCWQIPMHLHTPAAIIAKTRGSPWPCPCPTCSQESHPPPNTYVPVGPQWQWFPQEGSSLLQLLNLHITYLPLSVTTLSWIISPIAQSPPVASHFPQIKVQALTVTDKALSASPSSCSATQTLPPPHSSYTGLNVILEHPRYTLTTGPLHQLFLLAGSSSRYPRGLLPHLLMFLCQQSLPQPPY